MLNRATGLQMVHVPYRGSTPARQDVMGGTVPLYFDTVGGAITMLPTGRVKVLATSGAKRAPPMPAFAWAMPVACCPTRSWCRPMDAC